MNPTRSVPPRPARLLPRDDAAGGRIPHPAALRHHRIACPPHPASRAAPGPSAEALRCPPVRSRAESPAPALRGTAPNRTEFHARYTLIVSGIFSENSVRRPDGGRSPRERSRAPGATLGSARRETLPIDDIDDPRTEGRRKDEGQTPLLPFRPFRPRSSATTNRTPPTGNNHRRRGIRLLSSPRALSGRRDGSRERERCGCAPRKNSRTNRPFWPIPPAPYEAQPFVVGRRGERLQRLRRRGILPRQGTEAPRSSSPS